MIADLRPYAEYKESGLPWLGRIPGHWSKRRMKFLFAERVQKGFPSEPLLAATQTKGVVRKEDYGTRTVTAMKDLHLLKLVEEGDYVISLRSFQGGIEVAHRRGIISPAYTVLAPRPEIRRDYYTHFFKSPDFVHSLTLFVTGIREGQNIDYERLSRAYMPLPPEEEQEAMGQFLDWANARITRAIRVKKKLIALLNEQKQAIIHRAVTRGLDATAPFKSSGIAWLGDIPAHWEVLRLKNVLERPLANGLFKKKNFFGSGAPLINVADIYSPGAEIVFDKLGRVQATQQEISTFQALPGDIFFVRSSLKLEGTGRSAFIGKCQEATVFECHVVRARPISKKMISRYLALFLNSWWAVNYLISRANTVTMSTLPQGAINSIPLLMPPLPEQRDILLSIDSNTSPLDQGITRAEREIALLREYRTRLAADVVTGKLDVSEAAKNLPSEPEEPVVEPELEEQIESEATTLDEE